MLPYDVPMDLLHGCVPQPLDGAEDDPAAPLRISREGFAEGWPRRVSRSHRRRRRAAPGRGSWLPAFVKVAATIRKHREGILAAIRLGINNARAEGLNNHVRLIIRRAYGFHSATAALALVMLSCGPITLRLPHECAAE